MSAPVIHLNAVLKIAKNLSFHQNVCFAQEIKIPRTEMEIIVYNNFFLLFYVCVCRHGNSFAEKTKNNRVIPQEARI